LSKLPQADDRDLLVGYKTNDDAGVYRLTDDLALVVTADYITPPVNDPTVFGQVAAANALSDVYAMGAEPKLCLNLVNFPSKVLPSEVLHQIIAGAVSKITEAGAVLAGGHSVEDDEPKFGLSVVGIVHPDELWTNGGAEPGDALVLTKPLGSGVLFNANLKKWVSQAAMDDCVRTLVQLNKGAAQAMRAFDIHAVTDVTGFGLAGHALEMANASGACMRFEVEALPVMDEALAMYRKGVTTGMNSHNRDRTDEVSRFETELPDWHREIVFDPQTSGGLLVALPAEQATELVASVNRAQVPGAVVVGRVEPLNDNVRLVFS
jgi:selenide,water dikinase